MSKDQLLQPARAIIGNIAKHLQGDLSIQLWNGDVLPLGDNARDDVRFVIATPHVFRRLMLNPNLTTLFELYALGDIDIIGANPLDASRRYDHIRSVRLSKNIDRALLLKNALPFLLQGKTRVGQDGYDKTITARHEDGRDDKALIQFHYDLSNDFYALFLDKAMVYSCAYFPRPGATIDEAQFTKLDRICKKLRLKPGDRLLDIGSGWGGLVIHAAQHYGVHAHGVTLSQAQYDFAQARIAALGLHDLVKIELKDYRHVHAPEGYDKIAQVGMFEHVGFANFDTHFQHVHQLLRPRGLYLHHAITRRATPDISKFRKPSRYQKVISNFIFPGGELDYIGLTLTNLERHGFEVHDVEAMREHYQRTLEVWLERLYANREQAIAMVGRNKTRIWLLYLTMCARGFERGPIGIFQTLASKRQAGASGLELVRGDLA